VTSEDDLIKQAQTGSTEAFCRLAKVYERRVYSLALHYCRDREDAEDLSQEVWLKAYVSIATFRFEASFYTWLRRIMINCFLNYRRSSWIGSKTKTAELGPTCFIAAEINALEGQSINFENQLVIKKIWQGLAAVTSQQRLIFLLKHHEGMTDEEISRLLGCSVGTAKKSVARTVTKLRRQLGVNEDTTGYVSCPAHEC